MDKPKFAKGGMVYPNPKSDQVFEGAWMHDRAWVINSKGTLEEVHRWVRSK